MNAAATLTAVVHIDQLEPGTHIARLTIARDVVAPRLVTLPLAECMEPRPDWGEYSPIVTFPAIERALRARGYFPPLHRDYQYRFGIEK